MQTQKVPVRSIVPGYPFTHDILLLAANGGQAPDLADLTTAAQLIASVKANQGDPDPPLTTAAVVADAPNRLTFSMTAAQTQALDGYGSVAIDFARRDGAVWSPLPFVATWPVREGVTFP
jgi:hypothetical protein